MRFEQAFDPFRSIQAAWKLLKQAPLTVLFGGLLVWFFTGGGGGFGWREQWGSSRWPTDPHELFEQLKPMLFILLPILVCAGTVMFLFACWLQVGFARAIENTMRTGRDEVGKVFNGSSRFAQMVIARLLCSLIFVASVLPLVAVAIALWLVERASNLPLGAVLLIFGLAALLWLPFFFYVLLGLELVVPVIAYEDSSATGGIARAWRLASGHRLQLALFWIVMTIFGGIGCCACCIGLLLTAPMSQVMRFEAYLALTRGDEFAHWWVGSGRFPFDATPGSVAS